MFIQVLVIFFLTLRWSICKPVKSGVFDNVTVHLQSLDKTTPEDIIVIDYDDQLSDYVNDKPSEIIVIKNQRIPRLEVDSASNLLKVQNFTLTEDGIREIQRGAFKNLPNLKLLNLSHNAIEEVSHGVFNNLPLEDLFLYHNKISRIGYKAFSNLRVKNLFLNNNHISRWSKDWFTGSSVSVLNMGFNSIEELPQDSFHSMSEPVDGDISVIFSGNQLRKIDNDVFKRFESYKSVFLDGNKIDRLETGAFNGVKHINTLNLNDNSISGVDDLFKTTKLDVLMLEDNRLRCISTEVFMMEELDIDGNPITCFCVKTWLDWRNHHSNPSIYHITNLEEECI